MATVLRGPLLFPRQPVKQRPLDVIPNLLLTTLAVVGVAAPFNQTDWPAPKTLPGVQQFQPPNLTLSLPVAPPFQQTQWPAPIRQVLRSLDTQPNVTIRLDVPASPFTPVGWQTPKSVARITLFEPQNLLVTTLATPFKPAQWTLPYQPQRAGLTDPVNLLNTALAPVGQAPFFNAIWFAPPAVLRAPVFDPPNIALNLPVASPFAQYQWPLPTPGFRVVVIDVPNVTVNLPPGPVPPPPDVPVVSDQGGVRHQNVRHEKTLVERELERKQLFRKKKIRFALPVEQQEIVEKAVQKAAETPKADEALLAKATYLEELARWLGDSEKATAKALEELFTQDVENRKEEIALNSEEEEAIAILTAWWMNEG